MEDITCQKVGDLQLKSILAAVLDPETRRHTALHFGCGTTYQQVRVKVLEFVNIICGGGAGSSQHKSGGREF